MKYLCLVYLDEKKLDAVPDSECKACGDGLRSGITLPRRPSIRRYRDDGACATARL
jgi:hypothetical protein